MRKFLASSTLIMTAAAMGQVAWLNPVPGNWSDPSKWTAGNVPDNAGDIAEISVAGAYAVEFNGNFNFGGLTLTNPNATLNIQPNVTMAILTNNWTNNGLVLLNSTGMNLSTALRTDAAALTMSGTGTLRLNADPSNVDTAQMNAFDGGRVITNAASHSIRGTGHVRIALNNQGLLEADNPGETLQLGQFAKTNSGTMRAVNGATFRVAGINVNNSGGQIVASGANSVVAVSDSTITGGSMSASGGGLGSISNATFDGTTFTGPHQVNVNSSMILLSGGVVNNGTITVNPTADNLGTFFRTDQSTTLGGTGTLHLNATGNLDTAQMNAFDGGRVLTNGASHTIDGNGRIRVALTNDGVIRGSGPTSNIELAQFAKVNNNMIEAVAGGVVQFNAVSQTNTPTGVIRADGAGSVANYINSGITGGTLTASNGGLGSIINSTFSDLTLNGQHRIPANSGMILGGGGITNNGTITVNPSGDNFATTLRSDPATATLGGSGTVILNAHPTNPDTAQMNAFDGGRNLVIGANQTIRGTGAIRINTTNNGLIDANSSAGTLVLRQFSKTNNALMRATNGGTLSVEAISVANSGEIRADGAGSVVSYNGNSTITGGQLSATNGGVSSISNAIFSDTTFSGPHQVEANTSMVLNGGITNNGTITVNTSAQNVATALRNDAATATIGGSGTVILNAHPSNPDTAQVNAFDGNRNLVIGANQTIIGTGAIRINTTNNGLIDANNSAGPLVLRQFPKTNNNLMRASNGGALSVEAISVANNGEIRADGAGSVVSYNGSSTITGGQLTATNGGVSSISNAIFNGTTFSGPHQVEANTSMVLNGGITNNGTITVNTSAQNVATALRNDAAAATIGGSGTLLLNANTANLDTAQLNAFDGNRVLTIGPSQTVAGNGAFRLTTTLEGRLSPGVSAGAIGRIEQRAFNMTMAPSAELELDLNGLAAGQFDTVGYAGSVALDGTLRVHLANGFNPVQGDEFVILTAGSRSGTFEQIMTPNPGFNNAWRVRYEPTRAVLTVTCPPDVDGDHSVSLADLAVLLAHFGVPSGAAGFEGDVDGDGDVDLQDLASLLATFGTSCP